VILIPTLTGILYALPGGIIAIIAHEYAKSVAAYTLGDKSIRGKGRLSPNPFKHMDALGFIFMTVFRFGWGNPVGINFFTFPNKRKATAVIFAVPFLTNIILGVVFMLATRFWVAGMDWSNQTHLHIFMILRTAAHINIGHALFNLLPIHPLSGTMLLNALSPAAALKMAQYEKILQLVLAFFILLGGAQAVFGNLSILFLEAFWL